MCVSRGRGSKSRTAAWGWGREAVVEKLWRRDLNIRLDTIQLLEENIGKIGRASCRERVSSPV